MPRRRRASGGGDGRAESAEGIFPRKDRMTDFVTRGLAASTILVSATTVHRVAPQQLEPRPVPSRDIVSFTFQSPSMGVRYAVNVGLPVGFKAEAGRRYSALISTDGNWAFPVVYAAARSLMEQGAIDGLFVISIGVGIDEGDQAWGLRRIYEVSPPGWDMKDPFGLVGAKTCSEIGSAPGRCGGGAAQFLHASVAEVIARIR